MVGIRALRVDEEQMGLPRDRRDAAIPKFIIFFQSPKCRSWLSSVHLFSQFGVFCSIILLCLAIIIMGDGITTCEACVAVVALSFGLPHVLLALAATSKAVASSTEAWAMAAAAEASALGPQLVVILACGDIDIFGVHQLWQRLLCVSASGAFVASLCICGFWLPRLPGSNLPASTAELVTSLALDFLASWVLFGGFPQLRGSSCWILAAIGAICAGGMCNRMLQELIFDFLEPVMPLRSDHRRLPPAPLRDLLRASMRMLCVACALMLLYEQWKQPSAAVAPGTYREFETWDSDADTFNRPAVDDDDHSHDHESADYGTYDHSDDYDSHGSDYYDHLPEWSEDWEPLMTLQWLPKKLDSSTSSQPTPDDESGSDAAASSDGDDSHWHDPEELLKVVSDAMGGQRFEFKDFVYSSRLMLFAPARHHGEEEQEHVTDREATEAQSQQQHQQLEPVHRRWQQLLQQAAPSTGSNLSEVIEVGPEAFPAFLNATHCLQASNEQKQRRHRHDEEEKHEESQLSQHTLETVLESQQQPLQELPGLRSETARETYLEACNAWRRLQYYDSQYGSYLLD